MFVCLCIQGCLFCAWTIVLLFLQSGVACERLSNCSFANELAAYVGTRSPARMNDVFVGGKQVNCNAYAH